MNKNAEKVESPNTGVCFHPKDIYHDDLMDINEKLRLLIGINSLITSSLSRVKVLKLLLEQSKILLDCEKTSILLIDDETQQLKFEVLTNLEDIEKLSKIRIDIGEGIAGTVWKTGQPILINDTSKDCRFINKVDKTVKQQTISLLAVPLAVNGQIIGVFEAVNKTNNLPFNMFDLEIAQKLAIQSAIAIENANLYNMAITDGMTKLYLHKYFKKRLQETFKSFERYGSNASLVMLDLDHFKKINDLYGHQTGDEVLIKVSNIILNESRSPDIPSRYGGEEFAVILPNVNIDGAKLMAERLRKNVEDIVIEYEDQIIKVTISIGIASIADNKPKSSNDLIRMADAALYYSKKNGRNQINVFNNSMNLKAKED